MMSAEIRSRSLRSLSLAVAALALASPAIGLGAAMSTSPQARTAATAMDEADVRRFVNDVTVQFDGQLARYHQPLCPAVSGLKNEPALAIIERLHAAAGEVGLSSAEEGCDPNLVVMVVNDARAAVRALRKEGSLDMLDEAERRRVLAAKGPVIAFSDTEVQNDDGQPIGASTNVMFVGGGARTKSVSNLPVRSVSILNEPTQQATMRTIVVLEAGALTGKTLAQVGDLAAMWGIGGIRGTGSATIGAPSILSLLKSGEEAPAGLTAFDRAFLSAAYGTQANVKASIQRQRIAESISRTMAAQ